MKPIVALGLALGLCFAAPLALTGAPQVAMAQAPAAAGPSGRPPVEAFADVDQFRGAALSSDGRYIAGIRREAVGDVLVVLDWETKKSTPIQFARLDQFMEITGVRWKGERLIFTVQQRIEVVPGGQSAKRTERIDNAFIYVQRIWSSNPDGSGLVSLFNPGDGNDLPRFVSASIQDNLANDKDHVLLLAPGRTVELRKVNVRTGESTLVERGTRRTNGWIVDQNSVPVLRLEVTAGGKGLVWQRRPVGGKDWIEIVRFIGVDIVNTGRNFDGVGPAIGPGRVFVLARPDGKDTAGLYLYDANTGAFVEEIFSDPNFDLIGASSVLRDLDAGTILAACYSEYRWKCVPKDEAFGRTWRGIERFFGDQMNVRLVGRSSDNGKRVLVAVNGPQDMGSFYLYDREARSMDFIGGARPTITAEQLPTKRVVHYTVRDGMKQWAYLWLPPGVTEPRNLPLIVYPHGGPEARDFWGDDPMAQWLSSNGYLVVQPQFRGSGGFGRKFVEAGWGQWGQAMQTDVRDAALHLVKEGMADRNRMCIVGYSYGGYVAMTASFVDADLYKCSWAGAGVSDQIEMLRWERDGDASDTDVIEGGGAGSQGIAFKYWTTAQGDIDRDREKLARFSATRNADKIGMPVFLVHGDEDETVPVSQSQIMADAMRRAGKPFEFVILKDEAHSWAPMKPQSRATMFQTALDFVSRHIGPGAPPPPAPASGG